MKISINLWRGNLGLNIAVVGSEESQNSFITAVVGSEESQSSFITAVAGSEESQSSFIQNLLIYILLIAVQFECI